MENYTNPVNQEKNKGKQYLYHMVPQKVEGGALHPLNALKDKYPELYLGEVAKYEDRQQVRDKFIPTLQVAWNDVLHFTAVNPNELKQALVEAGCEPEEMEFYQVDPDLLDPEQTTIYLYNEEDGYADYNPGTLGEHATIPEATKEYYKAMVEKGEKPKLFVGVPHILHKGSIDISKLHVIKV